MSDNTKIEWTDATANVINGCTVVSPGCEHCYAMRLAATRMRDHPSRQGLARMHKDKPQWTGEVSFHEPALEQVLRWQRPRRIFWNAHGDTFHEKVPEEWIDRCFAAMLITPHHTHQVLTKRPERARAYLSGGAARTQAIIDQLQTFVPAYRKGICLPNLIHWPLPNVWLGTSVEDQQRADERIPALLDTPAAIRWLSMEPLLGPVDLNRITFTTKTGFTAQIDALDHEIAPGIDWVVVGGESGPDSRPMHPDWARAIRDQCEAAMVPFHFKQWGNWTPSAFDASDSSPSVWLSPDGTALDQTTDVYKSDCEKPCLLMFRTAKNRTGRLLDGVQHDRYPA